MEIETPHGPARAHVTPGAGRGSLVLGHGAGGSVQAPDLGIAAREASALGLDVVLVEQPYRVAGRRSPAPAPQLDAAWLAVLAALAPLAAPLLVGGRSSGARVACRTAAQAGAAGVLCLAFPLEAPRRSGPPASRLDELDAVSVPTLVVQGTRDRFGMPPPGPQRTVAQVEGDHGLKRDPAAIAAAVRDWLAARIG